MIYDRLLEVIRARRQRVNDAVGGLDQRLHGWLGVLSRAASATLTPQSAITAAAIAYFALFSLFPFILASIAIASYQLTPLLSQQGILDKLEFIAPMLGQLLGPNIEHIIHARGPITIIALISLVWSASSAFNMLNQTMSALWGYTRLQPLWERRGVAVLFVLVLAGPALMVISFAGSTLTMLYKLLPNVGLPVVGVLSILVSIALNVGLFELLYVIFPHSLARWRDLLPGAFAAGLLWELAKQAFVIFVANYVSAYNLIYGSVAAVIAFLTWAYLSGLIFLFGAYISLYYFKVKHRPSSA